MVFRPHRQNSPLLERLNNREIWVRLAFACALSNLFIVLLFTLYPLDFDPSSDSVLRNLREIDWDLFQDISRGRSYGSDLVVNLLLLVPFSASWVTWQVLSRRATGVRVVLGAGTVCFGISLGIECSQLLLADRFMQLADVSTNTIGATLAAFLAVGVLSEIDPQFKASF